MLESAVPLVSIIIPSYNQADKIGLALRSIAQQTLNDYEVIIMDGGSTDNTAAVAKKYSYLPLKFYSEPDNGIYDAMNKGIALSLGQYLYFMGCDDKLFSPNVLENIFNLDNVTDNDVVYGDVIFSESNIIYDGEFDYYKIYKYNICHQAIFTKKSVFDRLGNFDIRYKTYADWEFNMRWFVMSDIKRKYVPIVVAYFNTTGFSSASKDEVFFAEQDKIRKKYFSNPIRYLLENPNRFFHWRLRKFLSFKRVVNIKRILGFSNNRL